MPLTRHYGLKRMKDLLQDPFVSKNLECAKEGIYIYCIEFQHKMQESAQRLQKHLKLAGRKVLKKKQEEGLL